MCRKGSNFPLAPLIDFSEAVAPELRGLGDLHFEITTNSEEAQAFFDQGMRLVYAFNHEEAYRAFQEATRLDRSCAMAYWGMALALGPNINDALPDLPRQKMAVMAINKAIAHSASATDVERSLIEAYRQRCTKEEVDQDLLNIAYAEAMKSCYERFAQHVEVNVLYAASIMNTMPWDYYEADMSPKERTKEILQVLDHVVAEFPDHPGGHHYFIHLIEAAEPERALPSADRLSDLMPGAGHIVHMPSHIYIGLGMYDRAAEVNRLAISADEEYIAQCQVQGLYHMAYYPHNIHFLWAATSMLGNSQEAIDAAEKVALRVPTDQAAEVHFIQDFMSVPLQAYVRFGRWNDILSTPSPDTSLLHTSMMWHYARGIALSHKGRYESAHLELQAVRELASDPRSESIYAAYTNPTSAVGAVAVEALAGELAAEQGQYEDAIAHLKRAVEFEENLAYQEPSAWHYPMRHSLGAVLLEAGKVAEAEQVYRIDLEKNKGNGWSLFGLYQSLLAQSRYQEAKVIEDAFLKSWEYADIAITSSRF